MDRDRVTALAAVQHGVIALHQAGSVGMSPRDLHRHLTSAGWARPHREVFIRTGSPGTLDQRLFVRLLSCGPGVQLSHVTGAGWWGVPGFGLERVEVLTSRRSRRRHLADRVHVVDTVPLEWVTVHRGAAVCRPELVILQLCASVHPRRAERALDTAWAMRLLSAGSVVRLLSQLGRSGRNGTALLRELMAERDDSYAPAESNVEHRAAQVLHRAGLGPFRRQVDLGDSNWAGRVDLRHQELPLVVEVQSARFHSSLTDRRADGRRRQALAEAGLTVVEVTDDEVYRRPHLAVQRVARAESRLKKALS